MPIFENENEWNSPRISLKFIPKVRINNIPALVQIMAWRRPGDRPSSETMMASLLTHICVTRPQWVNTFGPEWNGCHFTDNILKWEKICVFGFKFNLLHVDAIQTLRKLTGFHWTEDRFWPDFANIKHDYTQELPVLLIFYQPMSEDW